MCRGLWRWNPERELCGKGGLIQASLRGALTLSLSTSLPLLASVPIGWTPPGARKPPDASATSPLPRTQEGKLKSRWRQSGDEGKWKIASIILVSLCQR